MAVKPEQIQDVIKVFTLAKVNADILGNKEATKLKANGVHHLDQRYIAAMCSDEARKEEAMKLVPYLTNKAQPTITRGAVVAYMKQSVLSMDAKKLASWLDGTDAAEPRKTNKTEAKPAVVCSALFEEGEQALFTALLNQAAQLPVEQQDMVKSELFNFFNQDSVLPFAMRKAAKEEAFNATFEAEERRLREELEAKIKAKREALLSIFEDVLITSEQSILTEQAKSEEQPHEHSKTC